MKIMKVIISSILVLTMLFTFIACDEEDNDTAAAETTTSAATTSEMEEDSVVTADTVENSAAEDTATENITEDTTAEDTVDSASVTTTKPAEDTTKAPTTTAPAEDTTKAPTTTAPAEDTTKAPTTTAPAESSAPNTDRGENYPLNMLPEPLPFTDKAEWVCIYSTDDLYVIATKEYIWNTNDEYQACLKIMEEYANSFTKYGYTVRTRNNNTSFGIFDEFGNSFVAIECGTTFSIGITLS